ncbi:MAG TPA: ABC transporter ATP-binding protein [Symbiobacteriaceae bacterium]|nr:ABC transporter ATP-binding protein [Symbiobacteriaceae bacterium]
MPVLEAINVTKVYGGQKSAVAVKALDGFSLTVEAGEFVGIMGPSGSGKTTLLQLLGTIDTPTAGEVRVAGRPLSGLKGDELALFRRRNLGFIFQDFNLLEALTIKENIVVPLALEGRPPAEIAAKVASLAGQMGLTEVLSHYPYEVSGGQKQRAAAARALIHAPALVLADEPTGNLDSKAARGLMEALSAVNEQARATIVMVTHDPVMASYCRRILVIKDGRLYTEIRRGADRSQFFHAILDVLSAMGGEVGYQVGLG